LSGKLTWNGTFTMAVGGMVGGGIFSVLGVVVQLAGAWAWLSFVAAGAVALLASLSYVALSTRWHQDGGSYGYLRHLGHERAAGSLAWVLVLGYVLTLSVYAFTFGHYLSNVLGLSSGWAPRAAAVAIIAALVVVNLRGVGDSQRVEEVTVWAKLAVLLGLAAIGLVRFDAEQLSAGQVGSGALGVVVGAASVFMAYEGFQLLAYDYDDIDDADRVLPRTVPPAVVVVIVTYVLVALGAASLVGAGTLVEQKEVALASAGRAALGQVGLVAVTIAAVFSTGSAINATMFATARLTRQVAAHGQYPALLGRTNRRGAPYAAVLLLGSVAALLAVVGGLSTLVEAASLVFLVTFAIVCATAWRQRVGWRPGAAAGAVSAMGAAVVLTGRLAVEAPLALAGLAAAVALTLALLPRVERHEQQQAPDGS
jgi:amino acid transporter